MRLLYCLIALLISSKTSSTSELAIARNLYFNAPNNEQAATNFLAYIDGYDGYHATLLAYKAAAIAIMAKHYTLPTSKIKAVKKAVPIFEKAISLAPKNSEIRFLRFSVEMNIPKFLGMKDHLEEDKLQFINNFSAISDLDLKLKLRAFAIQYMNLSPAELLSID